MPAKTCLSLAEVSRRLNVPYSRLSRFSKAGALPVAVLGPNNQVLFDAESLPEIRRALHSRKPRTLAK